jgi:hypothetical protein
MILLPLVGCDAAANQVIHSAQGDIVLIFNSLNLQSILASHTPSNSYLLEFTFAITLPTLLISTY